jgi:hypothetical protein
MATWGQYMSKLAHNERVKYMATYFNNAGVAALVAGLILPIFDAKPWWYGVIGIGVGAGFNLCAMVLLGNLKE